VEENYNQKGELTLTTITETVSNKLVLNILTPNGFISLTNYSGIGSFVDEDDCHYPDDDTFEPNHSDVPNFNEPFDNGATFADDDSELLFPLGGTVITDGASTALSGDEIIDALHRHQTGDFGTVSASDRNSNNAAIKEGDRILSKYRSLTGNEFWIITEHDRSVTTVLLPEEY